MREKLIELLNEAEEYAVDICMFNSDCEDCPGRKYGNKCRDYLKVDRLIANGVGLREQDCHWATEQAYKNGKADAMKWIPVTERLPENKKCVLMYSADGGVAEGVYEESRKRWVQWRWSVLDVPSVTHWMPLPEPPKEG